MRTNRSATDRSTLASIEIVAIPGLRRRPLLLAPPLSDYTAGWSDFTAGKPGRLKLPLSLKVSIQAARFSTAQRLLHHWQPRGLWSAGSEASRSGHERTRHRAVPR